MKEVIVIVGVMLVLLPGMALGQQIFLDKSLPTGKCWKVDMKSEADFYAKGWAKKGGFVGVVLLDDSMRYIKEGRINDIRLVDCTLAETRD
jgi:hypothetical protein